MDVDGPGGSDSFSWNPCVPFTENGCLKVAVSLGKGVFYSMANVAYHLKTCLIA